MAYLKSLFFMLLLLTTLLLIFQDVGAKELVPEEEDLATNDVNEDSMMNLEEKESKGMPKETFEDAKYGYGRYGRYRRGWHGYYGRYPRGGYYGRRGGYHGGRRGGYYGGYPGYGCGPYGC